MKLTYVTYHHVGVNTAYPAVGTAILKGILYMDQQPSVRLIMITWCHGSFSSFLKNNCVTRCDNDFLFLGAIDCGNLLGKERTQFPFAVWVTQKVTPVPWGLVFICDFSSNTLPSLFCCGFFDAAGVLHQLVLSFIIAL